MTIACGQGPARTRSTMGDPESRRNSRGRWIRSGACRPPTFRPQEGAKKGRRDVGLGVTTPGPEGHDLKGCGLAPTLPVVVWRANDLHEAEASISPPPNGGLEASPDRWSTMDAAIAAAPPAAQRGTLRGAKRERAAQRTPPSRSSKPTWDPAEGITRPRRQGQRRVDATRPAERRAPRARGRASTRPHHHRIAIVRSRRA